MFQPSWQPLRSLVEPILELPLAAVLQAKNQIWSDDCAMAAREAFRFASCAT